MPVSASERAIYDDGSGQSERISANRRGRRPIFHGQRGGECEWKGASVWRSFNRRCSSSTAPFGAIVRDGGVQFVVYSPQRHGHAAARLQPRLGPRTGRRHSLPLTPTRNVGATCGTSSSPASSPGQLYHLQADGPNDLARAALRRPRGSSTPGLQAAGRRLSAPGRRRRAASAGSASWSITCDFEWQGDRPINRPLSESIIYRCTSAASRSIAPAATEHPGTYLGVIEKIPHLRSLGITAVELMPVHEFPINAPSGVKEDRSNYWGYDPMAFFSPHRGYVSSREPAAQVREFKQMVRAPASGRHRSHPRRRLQPYLRRNEYGPTISFKGWRTAPITC